MHKKSSLFVSKLGNVEKREKLIVADYIFFVYENDVGMLLCWSPPI